MTEQPIVNDDEVRKAPQPEPPAPADVVFEAPAKDKEPWRGGTGCGARAPLYGCVIALALLIAALMAGTAMMRRTVWLNMDRGRRAVVQALPADLPPAERERTIHNLDRFRSVLEAAKDPYPEMGEFMRRARAILEDGRLTVDEIGGLNVYLERVIEASGIPLMQLGSRVRNSRPRLRRKSPGGEDDRHSEFRIPNSEFT